MVKLCQGRREETCVPFFVALMDVFQELVFAYVHIFVIPEGSRIATMSLSRGRVRMNHNRMGTSSRGMFPCSLCLHGKRGVRLIATPLDYF